MRHFQRTSKIARSIAEENKSPADRAIGGAFLGFDF